MLNLENLLIASKIARLPSAGGQNRLLKKQEIIFAREK